MKTFIEKATSPKKMAAMLKEETARTFVVNITPSFQPPFIDEEELDKYMKEEETVPDKLWTMDEKVKFLLERSYAHGIENLKRALGAYFTEIPERAERDEDITEWYRQAMKIIKSRYEYLT